MPTTRPPGRKWILVADDDPHVRHLWAVTLRESGYSVIEARNGLEAVDAMRFMLPDLVLLDLRMPHLSGQDVLAAVRGSPIVGRIPVLIVSGNLPGERRAPLGLNIVGWLAKPVRPLEILRAAETALDAGRLRPPDVASLRAQPSG